MSEPAFRIGSQLNSAYIIVGVRSSPAWADWQRKLKVSLNQILIIESSVTRLFQDDSTFREFCRRSYCFGSDEEEWQNQQVSSKCSAGLFK